jgi:hypothetical protein
MFNCTIMLLYGSSSPLCSQTNQIAVYVLSNTTLFDGRDMCRIYYIKNYIFRPFTMAIFRLRNEKNLGSSYTRLMCAVDSGLVRGELGGRSRMCCVGWVVWVHGGCAVVCYV